MLRTAVSPGELELERLVRFAWVGQVSERMWETQMSFAADGGRTLTLPERIARAAATLPPAKLVQVVGRAVWQQSRRPGLEYLAAGACAGALKSGATGGEAVVLAIRYAGQFFPVTVRAALQRVMHATAYAEDGDAASDDVLPVVHDVGVSDA